MKQVADFLEQFDRCLANEPAFCTAKCPFRLDVREFAERIGQGRVVAAYKLYRDAVGFPAIVSELCGRPCEDACPLKDVDRPIAVRGLERFVVAETEDTAPNDYNLPPRGKRVAVIGAGLAGLGCALRLATKKYQVEVFEATETIGGSGWPPPQREPASVRELGDAEGETGETGDTEGETGFAEREQGGVRDGQDFRSRALADIELQFRHEDYILHLGRRIASREEVNALGFDAVFAATGAGGEDFGLLADGGAAILSGEGIAGAEALQAVRTSSLCLPSNENTAKADPEDAGSPAQNANRGNSAAVPDPGRGALLAPSGHGGRRGGLSDLSAGAGTGWFAGGALIGKTNVSALANGLLAGAAIDAFLRTGNLACPSAGAETRMVLAPFRLEQYAKNRAQSTETPSADYYAKEAARCLKCRCDACMLYADLPAYAGKWPLRIRDEVFATTLPGKAEVKATPARRLINTGNLSGAFEKICPVGIDLDGLLLAGRQSMHRQEKMPWAFHEFHLRDMEHADGESAALTLVCAEGTASGENIREARPNWQRGSGAGAGGHADPPAMGAGGRSVFPAPARYAFFPGCQLGAGNPALPMAAWEALRRMGESGEIRLAGLILRCCGAPAEWAGDEALLDGKTAGIRAEWERLGKPALLMACPSCMRLFEKYLPEIEIAPLYDVLQTEARAGGSPSAAPAAGCGATVDRGGTASGDVCEWAVFDACAAARLKSADALRAGVRRLARSAGLLLRPLPMQDAVPRCCGFGGQPDLAAPAFARRVAEDRVHESDLPYVCYCMNCRDAFAKAGKNARHILEILFPEAGSARVPTVTERRENRECLKANLLRADVPDPLRADFPNLLRVGLPDTGVPDPRRAGLPDVFRAGLPKQEPERVYDFELEIDPDLLAQMDQDRILADDARAVVDQMRKTHRSIYHVGSGARSGCLLIGRTTYWVDIVSGPSAYGICNAGVTGRDPVEKLRLRSAYSHRIAFEPEAVWNALRLWAAGGTQHALPKQKGSGELRNAAMAEKLICERCGCEMDWMEAEFSYLGRRFRHKVMRCPECGTAYVPEELARGRMRIVEMALEEK
jgi:Fe-S oxidoreductase